MQTKKIAKVKPPRKKKRKTIKASISDLSGINTEISDRMASTLRSAEKLTRDKDEVDKDVVLTIGPAGCGVRFVKPSLMLGVIADLKYRLFLNSTGLQQLNPADGLAMIILNDLVENNLLEERT